MERKKGRTFGLCGVKRTSDVRDHNLRLYRDALAQGQRPIHFTVFLTGQPFLSYPAVHVAPSLKPLSKT